MINKIFITSGKKYIDIDGYAAMISYRELLKSLGYNAFAVTSAIVNESVPEIILNMGFKFDDQKQDKNTKFIIVDTSNPDFLEDYIEKENIIEIIDHHSGYEEYWKDFDMIKQIENIGSVCTIIFEKIVKNKKLEILTSELCKILVAGILDNTLNLKSNNTTQRDISACTNLLKIGNIDNNWSKIYFEACYENSNENLEDSIKKSIKIEKTGDILPEILGQLIFLNKESIFKNVNKIKKSFNSYDKWLFNAICLEEGKSYLFGSDRYVIEKISILFDGVYNDDCFVLNNCVLRKEIMKKARNIK